MISDANANMKAQQIKSNGTNATVDKHCSINHLNAIHFMIICDLDVFFLMSFGVRFHSLPSSRSFTFDTNVWVSAMICIATVQMQCNFVVKCYI